MSSFIWQIVVSSTTHTQQRPPSPAHYVNLVKDGPRTTGWKETPKSYTILHTYGEKSENARRV
ncbi:MAG: hypothetical protein ABSF15_05110 [Candidatus Sulfotelmatobacter sp.]|jgi:hypothetical protein